MFQTLGQTERRQLASYMKEEILPRGRVLFEVGDPGSSLYIIGKGKIRISVPGDSGEEMTLATLGAGEFFGEFALLDGMPRSARATAAEDAKLYSLERESFLTFVGQTPNAALAMLSATVKRLRHTDELMRTRASFDVNVEFAKHETRGGRWASRLAGFAGSWGFMWVYVVFVLAWIGVNVWMDHAGRGAFDDTSQFAFLALFLGVIASLQAPIIMMSQNRDQIRDQIRSDADFRVNLKNEVAIEKTLERLEEMRRTLPEMRKAIGAIGQAFPAQAATAAPAPAPAPVLAAARPADGARAAEPPKPDEPDNGEEPGGLQKIAEAVKAFRPAGA